MGIGKKYKTAQNQQNPQKRERFDQRICNNRANRFTVAAQTDCPDPGLKRLRREHINQTRNRTEQRIKKGNSFCKKSNISTSSKFNFYFFA